MAQALTNTKVVHAVCTHDCSYSCGVLVTVDTLTGRATRVQGVVSARLDWQKVSPNGANVNVLTSERQTDLDGGPTFYSTLVEVAKAMEMAAD